MMNLLSWILAAALAVSGLIILAICLHYRPLRTVNVRIDGPWGGIVTVKASEWILQGSRFHAVSQGRGGVRVPRAVRNGIAVSLDRREKQGQVTVNGATSTWYVVDAEK